jgi:TRAP-type uncharacterized transport system substrate-binding protein
MAAFKNVLQPRLILFAIAAVATIGVVVWSMAGGVPPRKVEMATGPEGGSYAEFGQRYRAILARSGVNLELVPTAGATENLAKLRDARSGVSAGFVMAGLPGARDSSELETLGSIAYEPVWLFERASERGVTFAGLAGKRLSLGGEGSGTRVMALMLLALAGGDISKANLLDLSPAEAAERLLRGDIDVVALVESWDSPVVRQLIAAPDIALITFRRADAFVALTPHLAKLVLPEGAGNLAANRPPKDVVLIAPKASLVVRRDLHEAIQFLLVEAASQIHSRPGIFHAAGAFPAAESIDFPLSSEAARFYKSGRPLLHRYLPFWMAVLSERLLVLLIPLVALVLPLVRVVPSAYRGLMQQRITALYGELKMLETELDVRGPAASADLITRLDALDLRAARLHVPLSFAQMLYTLKAHIRLVRERLASGK